MVPSESVIRDVLVRVDTVALDAALQRRNEVHGRTDDRPAIDGKTMHNAINEHGDRIHIMSVAGHQTHQCYTRQTVGYLTPEDDEQLKRTNEIKVAAPLPDAIDIRGKEITADALPTRRQFAAYLVEDRQAHYHFTIKGNQPDLLRDVALHFDQRREPDGRIPIFRVEVTAESGGGDIEVQIANHTRYLN